MLSLSSNNSYFRGVKRILRNLFAPLMIVATAVPFSSTWAAKGIVIYKEYPSSTPKAIEFEEIFWRSRFLGRLKNKRGREYNIDIRNCKLILYFDSTYYGKLRNDKNLSAKRAYSVKREICLETNPENLQTDRDFDNAMESLSSLTRIASMYSLDKGAVPEETASLNSQLERYKAGDRKERGIWHTRNEWLQRQEDIERQEAQKRQEREREIMLQEKEQQRISLEQRLIDLESRQKVLSEELDKQKASIAELSSQKPSSASTHCCPVISR